MKNPVMNNTSSKITAYLGRPLSSFYAVVGWLVATGVFFAFTQYLGGPVEGDAAQSVYSTWAIQHGYLACTYPPAATHFHFPIIALPYAFVAPFWPLLTGGIAALLRIGRVAPFPHLGDCTNATVSMYHWMANNTAALDTVRLGYVAWLFLLVGVVAYLRSTGRGKTWWEPFALLVLAVTPSVWMPLLQYFHPQDIVALGLSLIGLSFVRRDRWLWAGLFLGVAFTSQQFAVLLIVMVMALAPRSRYLKLFGGLALGVAVIDLPIVIATSGRAFRTVILGSSRNSALSTGGTVLWEAHFQGVLRFFAARVLPVLVAGAIAWWMKRRIGDRVFDPVPLTSLVALAILMRLVFEINLFGYYFMATAVVLILLDVVRGHIRGLTVAWLLLTTAAFNPVPFGFVSNDHNPLNADIYRYLSLAIIVVVAYVIAHSAVHRRVRWYWIATLAMLTPIGWQMAMSLSHGTEFVPNWAWQVILVSAAILLAVDPLRGYSALKDNLGAEPLGVPLSLVRDSGGSLAEGSTSGPE